MAVTHPESETVDQRREQLAIIDCDVHNALRFKRDLLEYMPERWHVYAQQPVSNGGPFAGLTLGAKHVPGGTFDLATVPPSGQAGSDLDLMCAQLLDPFNVGKAILHPVTDITMAPMYGEVSLAICAAVNDWMVAEWLGRDERLYGAITVPIEDGERAAAEIRRVAGNPRFVKVMLTSPTKEALGHPKYWPIYEAADSFGLPIASHVGGVSGTCVSTGWPMYHIEFHAGSYPQAFQAQVASLIYSGVFDRFPNLQFVLEEGGIGWMAALMWRLDRTWKAMRDQAPHLERLPSEVIREHFWFTTQPFDEPEKHEYLRQLLESLDMNDRIMFSSDYPHWDRDDPTCVLPAAVIGSTIREKIFSTNATHLFRFEAGS